MASALDLVRPALEAALVTAWAAGGYPATALGFGNVKFVPTGKALWARMEVIWGDATMISMQGDGFGANDISGIVMVNCFVPQGTGTGVLTVAANVVRDCFNRKAFGLCQCMAASGPNAKPDPEDPAWFMSTIRVPFRVIDAL